MWASMNWRMIWLTGSLYGRSWAELWPLLAWVGVFAPLALLLARDLNALNLGEEVARGVIPPDSVVMRAERKREFPGGEFYLPCALIVRRLQPGDRDHVNDILRESGVTVS